MAGAILVALASGHIAWKNAGQARESNAALAAMAPKQAAMAAEVQMLAARITVAESGRTNLPGAARAPAVGEPAKPLPDPTPRNSATRAKAEVARAWRGAFDEAERRDLDPKWQNHQLAMFRTRLAANYSPLYRALGLSPAQIEQFEANALKRDEQFMDLSAMMRTGKLSPQNPVDGQLWAQVAADFESAQRVLLGEEGFGYLREYERTLPVRDTVRALAGAAAVAGLPYTAQQAERLTEMLAAASGSYRSGGNANPAEIDWDLVDAHVAEILTPEQVLWLRTVEPTGQPSGRFNRAFGNALSRAEKADAANQVKATGR